MTCVEASVAGVAGNDKAEVRTLYLLVQELVGLPRTKAEILSPYVRVTLGKVQFDTAVQEKTSSPAWLEKFAIELPALPVEINLQAWSRSDRGSNVLLGEASVTVTESLVGHYTDELVDMTPANLPATMIDTSRDEDAMVHCRLRLSSSFEEKDMSNLRCCSVLQSVP
eukprot:CAMPEP_0173062728 /NCGR_PEP_ID=MMETSP1102-20130122/3972_1 /TAXON_ID=49646 /ORGANISM="Geminigera sp., Strain Caron Lab Isolate" /LENGTH=167 /DNA_ID=CAMNT_0013929417 /DNA_START=30 /DNA_END=530 /DNA_ORIENTATION=+